jgi:prepilin-type N-terminal cleavage/methylation domain-containing protein
MIGRKYMTGCESPNGYKRDIIGFTLVELMISIAILGLMMTVIFALFSTTSDSLREADSLAHALERARFSAEQVSSDLRNAGAFASPDSINDPRIKPDQIGSNSLIRVTGVASYNGWQNDDTLFSSDIRTAHTPIDTYQNTTAAGTEEGVVSTGGTAISFDGFILFGAIDFPQTFEIANIAFDGAGEAKGAWIPATESSMYKLLVNDPFYTETGLPNGLNLDVISGLGHDELIVENLQNRMVRVMDRNGMVQISGVSADSAPVYKLDDDATDGVVPGPTQTGIYFELRSNWAVQSSAGQGQVENGLERSTSGDEDIRYNAALIDAYWYHVEQDPQDPVNYRLVRERLDAHATAVALRSGANNINKSDLTGALAARDAAGAAARDKVVITDRVVDFQVWFDCADSTGNVAEVPWQMKWPNPAGVSNDTVDCMAPAEATLFGQARMAHVRLSLRTMHERKNAPDDPDALFMNKDGNVDALMPLRYFNMNPDAEGSARVVTVQSDVELTNFAMRNITP